jgi:SAM-dependent methyltransferase
MTLQSAEVRSPPHGKTTAFAPSVETCEEPIEQSKSLADGASATPVQVTPSAVVDSLPEIGRLWTQLILDGERGQFTPPLYQEQYFGLFTNPGDLYVRRELTAGEQLCAGTVKGRVLELGAGFGRVSHALRERGLEVVTTDADPELVAMYQARGWKDACEVSLPDVPASLGKFDAVVALRGVLSLSGEIDQVHRSLRRIRRLLNPGGRLIFTSGPVNTLVVLPGRSPLEYNTRFIYRQGRSSWLKFTALPEWLAVPFLRGLGFVNIQILSAANSDGAGYFGLAQLSE